MNPDSWFWLLYRRMLAALARLEPAPAAGRAWCVTCSLSEGRTLDLPADELTDHLTEHTHTPGASGVQVRLSSAVLSPGEPR